MKKTAEKTVDGKKIKVYKNTAEDAPIVFINMYADTSELLILACRELKCPPFHLAAISRLDWDADLSPWPHEPVVSKEDHFTGNAACYMQFILDTAVPFAKNTLPGSAENILAGYSMGGLFALYAPYLTDAFPRLISVSGSVWFPGFMDYVFTHSFIKEPLSIYLSIGDRESKVRNPVLQQTEGKMKEFEKFYRAKGIKTIFELNPGNHYQRATERTAKGICWTLNARLQTQQ